MSKKDTQFIENDLQAVEVSIEDAKEKIRKRDALKKLIDLPQFKEIVDEGYFKEEAVRLVHLKADYNMQDPQQQEFVIKAIDAIGVFRGYLSRIFQQGNSAENALKEYEATREEMLAENLAEGATH